MDLMGMRGSPPKPETAAAVRESSRGREVGRPERPTKRSYTAEFKQRVLSEVDLLGASGERGAQGAFLRREGLTWTHVHRWRAERLAGEVAALQPRKRGPKSRRDPLAEENARLRKQLDRTQAELRKAEIVIDVQKKVSALLGVKLPPLPDDEETS